MVTSYNIVVESLSNNDQLKKDFVEKNSSKMKQIEFLSGSCITSPNVEPKREIAQKSQKTKKQKNTNQNSGQPQKKSSGCFITTAVCNSFAKPDDCYELQSFRTFRDGWLRAQPDGAALIDEYYRVAPPIVERIDARSDAPRIYRRIWTEYLKPCLRDIEAKNYMSCKDRYVKMVRSLERMFGA